MICTWKEKTTLISTVQPSPPTRSAAKMAFCRPRSIVSCSRRDSGLLFSSCPCNCSSQLLLTETVRSKGRNSGFINFDITLLWKSTEESFKGSCTSDGTWWMGTFRNRRTVPENTGCMPLYEKTIVAPPSDKYLQSVGLDWVMSGSLRSAITCTSSEPQLRFTSGAIAAKKQCCSTQEL